MNLPSTIPLRALATDYDGTIATNGAVTEETLAALARLKNAGFKLILVSGRELNDLQATFPELPRFDLAVLENGGLLFDPATGVSEVLSAPPRPDFVAYLVARGLPLSIGHSIVATWEPHETVVIEAIKHFGLELQVVFNKGAVMILPSGINKATGLRVAVERLGIEVAQVAGIGDAENDHAFLEVCGLSAAVANALPAIKERVHLVTQGDHGHGVEELIARLLATPEGAAV